MNFYLGVWNSRKAISDAEAAGQYPKLSDDKSARPQFDVHVYAFYSRLTALYPEIDMLSDDELDACPWACSLEHSGGHVVMAIQPEQADKMLPQVVTLAGEHELVCFNPQAGRVYLPPSLSGKVRTAPASG